VNRLKQSLIFILFIVVYISDRNSLKYCNGIESPALSLSVDESENVSFYLILQPKPHCQSNLNDLRVSSGVGKSKTLNIDLNKAPPEEGE